MLTLQFEYIRIVQSKFAKANLKKFRKRGGAVIDPPLSCQAAETPNKYRVTWRLMVTFLEIVNFDVVNARIHVILFSLTYIFYIQKMFTVYFFKKMVLVHLSLECLDRKNVCNGNKNDINF